MPTEATMAIIVDVEILLLPAHTNNMSRVALYVGVMSMSETRVGKEKRQMTLNK